ncbi:MAG: hypothetical protein ABL899_03185 [Nitrospira sp.]
MMFKIRIREFESDGNRGLELARESEILCPDIKAVGEKLKYYQHCYGRKGHQHWSLDSLMDDDSTPAFYVANVEREDGSMLMVYDPEMEEIGLRVEFDSWEG